MASRKYITLLALTGLIATASFAQRNDASYSWVLDSSKRSVKNMPQQNEFMNNTYPYPAKPRNMWELGISGGASFIFSDIDPQLGFGGGLSVRKALGHIFSVRGSWNGSINKGLDYRLRGTPDHGGPWTRTYTSHGQLYVANYKNQLHQLSLDLIGSLNTISNYRGNPKSNIYVLAGYSIMSADVDVNALNGSTPYNFETMTDYNGKRSDIKKDIKDALDDSYENNAADVNGDREDVVDGSGNRLVRHGLNIGAGIAWKLSDRVNIGVEQKFTVPFDDNFDGLKLGQSNDLVSATQLRLNFNLGNPAKAVQPLWWLNPNNYVYNEVNTPKHMKIPTPVLPDADGDGVTDQFDMEPNTPAGAPVDSHGVSRDTDGDGVPDYKDKEPLTARDCFPVDADGIGKCPEPPCCAELRDSIKNMKPACDLGSLPSVQFKTGSLTLSSTAKAVLDNIAQQMNANPGCNIRVSGYYVASNKRSQQLGWDRVNTVIKYLTEQQGISESRLIWNLTTGGDPNTVDFMGTTETGPNTIPAPFPNLQKSK
ncbi:MAG TPA: OmpA family protein [Chitinophagaceae bacterium]